MRKRPGGFLQRKVERACGEILLRCEEACAIRRMPALALRYRLTRLSGLFGVRGGPAFRKNASRAAGMIAKTLQKVAQTAIAHRSIGPPEPLRER